MANPTKKYNLPTRALARAFDSGELKAIQWALAHFQVNNVYLKNRTATALADAAATLTAAQLLDSGLFTITPTAGRALTVDTGALILAAIEARTGNTPQVGYSFEFTIVNLGAQIVTLTTAASGTTLSGVATINNVSGTWIGVVTSASNVTFYRK